MFKVTRENVTKMSEDGLYLALDHLVESDEMFPIIEAELDRRIYLKEQSSRRVDEAKLDEARLLQQMTSQIHEVFQGFKGKKTLFLIENLGQEYIDDYVVDRENLTIHTKISDFGPWKLESEKQLSSHHAKLVYDRIYHRYFRDEPTMDNLQMLKQLLSKAA